MFCSTIENTHFSISKNEGYRHKVWRLGLRFSNAMPRPAAISKKVIYLVLTEFVLSYMMLMYFAQSFALYMLKCYWIIHYFVSNTLYILVYTEYYIKENDCTLCFFITIEKGRKHEEYNFI